MAYGIKVSEDIYNKAVQDKISVNKVMNKSFEKEIDKIKSEHSEVKDFSPVQLALFDSGLTTNSPICKFYANTGNEYLFPALLETKVINAVDSYKWLNMIINSTKTVDKKDVRTLKLDFSTDTAKSKLKMKDVTEGAELPEAKISESDTLIKMRKRGLKIVSSYETIQDSTINELLETIKNATTLSGYTQLGDAIDVLYNGDGNNNGAGSLGTFATADTITANEITNFLIDYYDATNGIACDTIICNKAVSKILANLFVDIDKVNGYRADKSFKFPQFNFTDINFVYDSRVPQNSSSKDIIILTNKAQGINKYTVANSIINEFDKNISNQTEFGTISERCGFGKINDNVTKYISMK